MSEDVAKVREALRFATAVSGDIEPYAAFNRLHLRLSELEAENNRQRTMLSGAAAALQAQEKAE